MKTASEMIVNTAFGHLAAGVSHNLQGPGFTRAVKRM